MPTTNQNGGTVTYKSHRSLVDDYGENPARFLAMSQPLTTLAIIRGMQDAGRANAWRAVELSEFGGREIVINAIDEQLAAIQGDGE